MRSRLAVVAVMLTVFLTYGLPVTAQGTAVLEVPVVTSPAAPCDEGGDTPYPYYYNTTSGNGGYWACHDIPIAVVYDGSTPNCSGPRVPIGNVAVNYGCANALLDRGPLGFCPVGVVGEQCDLWQRLIGEGNTNFLPLYGQEGCPLEGMLMGSVYDFASGALLGRICTP